MTEIATQTDKKQRKPRQLKYATEEERLEAKRRSGREYARRNREAAIENLRKYYDNNRERVYARNKAYRDRKKLEIEELKEKLKEFTKINSESS